MNADPAPGVDVEMAVGANVGIISVGSGIGVLAVAALVLLGGGSLIYLGSRRRPVERSGEAGGTGLDPSAATDAADAQPSDASAPSEGPPNEERRDEGG